MENIGVDLDASRGVDRSQFSVLFVDDEAENLRVFELAFRREFKVATAQGPIEALAMLAENPAAVVLSDQRMPGMTGVEFLTRVRALDPNTVRMLVTAYGDTETLSNAINEGCIARFIPKPWIPEEMRMTLRDGLDAYARDFDRRTLLRELEVVNRAGMQLCSELEPVAVVDSLLNMVVTELEFDGATVLLRDATEKRLEVLRSAPQAAAGSSPLEGKSMPIDGAVEFRRVLEEGSIERLTLDQLFELEPAVREFAVEIAAEEMLLVPLPGRSGSLGVLAVDNRRGGHPFDHANRTLLASLGAQASIAIDNARLVDDLRHSRELTRRADRLGTLGTLAAGLAHEINNPLVSIQTFLNLAPERRDADDPEFWTDYHKVACREVERIRNLVHSMSRLGSDPASRDDPEPEPCDLAELIGEAVQLVESSSHSGEIRIEMDLDSSLSKVAAVRDHLHQVVTNLLLNAVHASPSGGRVALRGRNRAGSPDQVVIEIQDWGTGIAAEVLDRVFDPFFTTKSPDQGAGLGLMIAHRIVTDHGGTIEVESAEEQGSTFRVVLPAA